MWYKFLSDAPIDLFLNIKMKQIICIYAIIIYIVRGWRMLWFIMMTSSNENIFHVTGPLCGEFIGHRWIPLTKTSDAGFDVFIDLHLINGLSKQSWGWWFETPSRPLWRHCNMNDCSLNYILSFNPDKRMKATTRPTTPRWRCDPKTSLVW